MGQRDAGRRLEPLAGLPQQVAQRPHRRDGDGAGAAGQDEDVVAPPAHVLQRVVLLLVCVQEKWRGRCRLVVSVLSTDLMVKNKKYIFFFFFFYNTLTSERKNGTPATDTAPPAGFVWDYITLLACPAPSCGNLLFIVGVITVTRANGVKKKKKKKG